MCFIMKSNLLTPYMHVQSIKNKSTTYTVFAAANLTSVLFGECQCWVILTNADRGRFVKFNTLNDKLKTNKISPYVIIWKSYGIIYVTLKVIWMSMNLLVHAR